MKKSSELLEGVVKQQRAEVTKSEDKIFKPEYIKGTSHISQKFLNGEYSVSFYAKKSDEKPKIQVVFSNLYEDIVAPSGVYYGDCGYKTISEKTTFSARVLNENSEEIGQKTKTALTRQSFKESLDDFLVVENSTLSTLINVAKKMVEKQLKKEEKQAARDEKREERKLDREEFKEIISDFVKYAAHGFRDL